MYTERSKIAKLAKERPGLAFTSLNHCLTFDLMMEAYRKTRKDGAVGVDDQTAIEYERNLKGNLRDLLERSKSGRYKAPPVRRVYIPKGNSATEKRPIGIPTFEDKVLQRAVVMVLESIYEQDFMDCSYGFRPKRSAHQALQAISDFLIQIKGGWVIDVDVRKFFDTMKHEHLREFIQHRVRDGVIVRLIGKWLNAGVMERGQLSYRDEGSPQGGVISPLLSNIYLHYVLDKWFHEVVLPRLGGAAKLVRFADDFIIVCKLPRDAERMMAVLPKRFEKHGLTIHEEKTRLIEFRRPRLEKNACKRGDRTGCFNFLGFTFYWGQSQAKKSIVKLHTAKDRLKRSITRMGLWCKQNRHMAVEDQYKYLNQALRGHYGYFGVVNNHYSLRQFYRSVRRNWRRWLQRRSQKSRMTWHVYTKLLDRYPLQEPYTVYAGRIA